MIKKRLMKKWRKAKRQLDIAKEAEWELRQRIADQLDAQKMSKDKVDLGNEVCQATLSKTPSPLISQVRKFKTAVPPEVFDDVFYSSYKIKPAAYKKLPKKYRKKLGDIEQSNRQITITIKEK